MEKEISLSDLFTILKQHIKKIVFWSLVGISLCSIYTFFLAVPQYQSTTKIVVNQTQNTGQAITNNDIQTNLNLIYTYQSIIKEPIILEEVIEKQNGELTVSELRDMITVQTQNDSLVFGVTVTDDSPYNAADLANATASSFESKIGNILEVESVTILSEATPNLKAVSPNPILNLAIGLILGLVIGIAISILSEITNKTLKDDNLIDSLGWVKLGSVFELTSEEIKSTRIKAQQTSRKQTDRITQRRV